MTDQDKFEAAHEKLQSLHEQPKTLLTALLAVQAELPNISLEKKGKNPAFKSKYLTLDGLHRAILPLLNRHGLVWSTQPIIEEGQPALRYRLELASGHPAGTVVLPEGAEYFPLDLPSTPAFIEGTMPLMLDKQNSQGLGSAITYARRYSLLSVIGAVGDEDDDGNKASQNVLIGAQAGFSRSEEQPTKAIKPESRILTAEELEQVRLAVEKAGKSMQMAAKTVGKDDPFELTQADGWEILRKVKEASKREIAPK